MSMSADLYVIQKMIADKEGQIQKVSPKEFPSIFNM